MGQALAEADASNYYQRPAGLSTLPFWQRPETTEPARARALARLAQAGHPSRAARRRGIADEATALQRRALILHNPGLILPAGGCQSHDRGGVPDALPGDSAPVHAHPKSVPRFGATGGGACMVIDGGPGPGGTGDLIPHADGTGTATSTPCGATRTAISAVTPPLPAFSASNTPWLPARATLQEDTHAI